MEKELFRNLLTDQEEPFSVKSPDRPAEITEHDSYMSATRMAAWARLHIHHRKKPDAGAASTPETPDLLITGDQTALEQLLESADSAGIICTVSGIPFGTVSDLSGNVFFNEQRCEKLRELAANSDLSSDWDTDLSDTDSGNSDTGRLTIYRMNGDAIVSFLSKSGGRLEKSDMYQNTAEKRYTLVGSIIKNLP